MKNNILKKLIYTKIMLLICKKIKRQKYINNLNVYVDNFLKEFNNDVEINDLMKQINSLSNKDRDLLFLEEFWFYKFLKFSDIRIEIDNYNFEEYKTFYKFNKSLELALLLIDYENNLKN